MQGNGKRVAFRVLGCKVNQNEAEALKKLFRQAHYKVVDFTEEADVYVIHTCTVTHVGDRKSRQAVRQAVHSNPEAVIAVTGCYSQVAPEEVQKIPGVDLVLGTRARSRLVEYVENVSKSRVPLIVVQDFGTAGNDEKFEEMPAEETGRARAFIKIEEGCEQFCSYCIVPRARGPVRSRKPENVFKQMERLREAGFQEVVLTGVHIGAYGTDLPGDMNLGKLIKLLLKLPKVPRIRLSSIEPNELTADLKEIIASESALCPHLHIPLQSGDDVILGKMNRRYVTAEYAMLVEELRVLRPGIALTTDVMVGFPGETENRFQNTYDFLKQVAFSGLHVFQYSPRQGTPAASFSGQVDAEIKKIRSAKLRSLGEQLRKDFARAFLGKTLSVLVERKVNQEGLWEGHAENYILTRFPAKKEVRGKIVPVTLEEVTENYARGRLVQKERR